MLKVKHFRETPGFCGPASLKMVLDYYGVSLSEAKIAKLTGFTMKKGTSKEDLIRAAKKLGFKAFSKENSSFADIKKFIRKKIPVIVDWFSEDDGHYSVVIGIDKRSITLMDPQLDEGKIKFSLSDFYRVWFDFPGNYIKSIKDIVLRVMIVVSR